MGLSGNQRFRTAWSRSAHRTDTSSSLPRTAALAVHGRPHIRDGAEANRLGALVLVMLLRVLIMLLRVLIMRLRVLIMLLRALIMLLRVLIMLLRVLIMLLRVLITSEAVTV